jgi:Uri superfamily endonuclease
MTPLHPDIAQLIARLQAEMRAAGFRTVLVSSDTAGEIGNRTGAYLLTLRLPHAVGPEAPRPLSHSHSIEPGCYVYAGSAYGPGGLAARLRRHLRPSKAVHWHIDRLTMHADGMAALAVPDGRECKLVEALLRTRRFGIAIPGFGSTDCRNCESHLLAASNAE